MPVAALCAPSGLGRLGGDRHGLYHGLQVSQNHVVCLKSGVERKRTDRKVFASRRAETFGRGDEYPKCTIVTPGRRGSGGVASQASSGSDGDPSPSSAADGQQYSVTLRKPLGIIFEELPDGKGVYIAELVAGGNADKSAKVQPGDVLVRTSAVVLKQGKEGVYEKEGYGQRPYTNWSRVDFDCRGQDFDTIMSAIQSNNERWGFFDVQLEFVKP